MTDIKKVARLVYRNIDCYTWNRTSGLTELVNQNLCSTLKIYLYYTSKFALHAPNISSVTITIYIFIARKIQSPQSALIFRRFL